jgi:hypothetical protein
MSLYKLPKFSYEVPVLDSSKAIVVDKILAEELQSNYKSLTSFLKLLKHPMIFTPMVIGLGMTLFILLSPVNEKSAMYPMLVIPIAFTLFGTGFGFEQTLAHISDNLKLDIIPSRNQAIANWVKARYGVDISENVVNGLIYELNSENSKLVRVNDSLIRFQTVTGEGELLFDSAGNEWKLPVTV